MTLGDFIWLKQNKFIFYNMMIPFISLYGHTMMLRSLDIGQLVIEGRPRLNFLLRPGDTWGCGQTTLGDQVLPQQLGGKGGKWPKMM